MHISGSAKDNKYNQIVELMNKGLANDALDECRQLLAANPEDSHLLYLTGAVYFTVKRYPDALEWLTKAVELKPENKEYLFLYGDTLRLCGFYDKSEKVLLQMLNENPDHDRVLISLGLIYDGFRQWHQAAEYFERAVALKPSNSVAHQKLAEMLLHTGNTQAALSHAKKAAKLKPKEGGNYQLLAIIHQTLGDKDKARQFLQKCIEVDPMNGGAYNELVKIRKVTREDGALIKRMEKQLEKGMASVFRNQIDFALAKAYDDLKEYEKAFEHLHQGNLLLKGEFELGDFKRTVRGIKKAYKSDSMLKLQDSGNPSRAPVFVVGMPRSGTTLIDQILSSHSQVESIGESQEIGFGASDACTEAGIEDKPSALPELSQELIKKYAQRYLDRAFAEAAGAQRIVDKMPSNFFQLGHILRLFPNAKIIHSIRHPLDTALSCYFQRFTASIYMEWSNDLAMLGQYYRGYVELMEFWKQRFPTKILDIRYEDMVQDVENNSRRIIDFIELDWEDACLEFYKSDRVVQTASLWQVRNPIYKSSVGRWQHYAKHLGPLVESLGDILTDEDYQALREEGLEAKRPRGWMKRVFAR
jgi:tetratricopeptide (TPR) repeat protein